MKLQFQRPGLFSVPVKTERGNHETGHLSQKVPQTHIDIKHNLHRFFPRLIPIAYNDVSSVVPDMVTDVFLPLYMLQSTAAYHLCHQQHLLALLARSFTSFIISSISHTFRYQAMSPQVDTLSTVHMTDTDHWWVILEQEKT